MAEYRISGIWKDNEGVITHYAIHSRTGSQLYGFSIGKGIKTTKADAVTLIAHPLNTAKTYLWNYLTSQWTAGEDIHVVNANPSFLRTNHDGTLQDNLLHLINYGYVY